MYRPGRARSQSPARPASTPIGDPSDGPQLAYDIPDNQRPDLQGTFSSIMQRWANKGHAPPSDGPSSAPPIRSPDSRLPTVDDLPRRSSTVGSPGEQDRERDYFERDKGRAGGVKDSPTRLNTLPSTLASRQRPTTPQERSMDVQQELAYAHHRSNSPGPTPQAQLQHPGQLPLVRPPAVRQQSRRAESPAGSVSSRDSMHGTPSQVQMQALVQSQPRPRPPSSSGSDVSLPNRTVTPSTFQQPVCCTCNLVMTGQFVRALGNVYHLDCFRCRDCDRPVAQKFFPIEGADGRQQPLCERDYFRRLNLICGKCGEALRGSYITACNKKFHVEHFTCSVCPTLFGQSDSYYEHGGDVYCHFHYSTRFATKCVGCGSAILKQFVEINRNQRNECWHPECYMIHRVSASQQHVHWIGILITILQFWNVKMTSKLPPSEVPPLPPDPNPDGSPPELQPTYQKEEATENAVSLRNKQRQMEQQVYRIWNTLSQFEESSATCIQNMLNHVANGHWLEAIRFAEKFILHVEVLFAVVDDLEAQFIKFNAKGMSHIREARMLCRKTVDLFTLLSRTEHTVDRRMRFTEELLAVVTGLAHYLKILIRIALTGSLKLEREYDDRNAGSNMLDKLQGLVRDGANPSAPRATRAVGGGTLGTQGVIYGYKCLSPEYAGESPFSPNATDAQQMDPPSDLCIECNQTVEEDCVRLGTYARWHSQCLKCERCGRIALAPSKKETAASSEEGAPTKISTSRRPPALAQEFVYRPGQKKLKQLGEPEPLNILCITDGEPDCKPGFEAVTKLEQFAYLLNVALRRLYDLLRRKGWMALPSASAASDTSSETRSVAESYRDSTEIMRLKSVHLDRKLSATARVPKRSTIVESPSGKIAQPTDATFHSSIAARTTPVAEQSHYQQQQQQQPSSYRPQPQPHAPVPTRLAQPPSVLAHQQLPPPPPFPAGRLQSPSPGPAISINPDGSAVIRPSFARNNTSVRIIAESDESATAVDASIARASTIPESANEGDAFNVEEDAITLADIPHMMEAEQAREQQRSLPRQAGKPLISDLSALELMVLKHFSVLVLNKSPMKDQFDLDEILDLIEVKNKGLWGKLFKGEKKNVKKKGAFGVPLELLVDKEGVDSLLGASRTALRVPSFIDDIVSAMKQMDMSVEGVFRKNGNIRRLKELADHIDRDPSTVDLSTESPVQLAALLKKFLGELPDPLLTFKLHKLFTATQKFSNVDDRRKYMHLVSMVLPKAHRDTAEVLFVFLKWVASFSHVDAETGSKMDLQNLATVIAPSVLYSRGRDPAKDEIFLAIRVVSHFLELQDELYAVPDEFIPILHDMEYFVNCAELPRKEILKKCETYWKIRHPKPGANGLPPSSSYRDGLGRPEQYRGESQPRLITRRSDPAMSHRPSPPQQHANGTRTPQALPPQPPMSNYSGDVMQHSLGSWVDVNAPEGVYGSPPNGQPMPQPRNSAYEPVRQQARQPDSRWIQQPERPQTGSRPASYVRTEAYHTAYPP
ncbi:RhoGAP-domain-containing protein [Calocera viscosa TUFC12733]|uniref:RhoGAP-domain-containing protein n=1 Tax=Calocera viscosa (strain TUFC12733) TaxID=1330018 RepID=A0A167S4A4_CALVF|nr:RhoGAP-domain-containing protein [Calocera viscosa TUFC12733]